LAAGKRVTVHLDETERTRGNYGRLLAYLELPDGTVLNELLLAEGYVYADLRFRHSYFHKYGQLEASARALRKGLWAEVTRDDLPDWLQRMRPNLLAD
jgi:endonuclease YncB( thermonuclease family)